MVTRSAGSSRPRWRASTAEVDTFAMAMVSKVRRRAPISSTDSLRVV